VITTMREQVLRSENQGYIGLKPRMRRTAWA
jgi:hypothetical protein